MLLHLCHEELDRYDESEALFPNIVRYGRERLSSFQHGKGGLIEQTVSGTLLDTRLYDRAVPLHDDIKQNDPLLSVSLGGTRVLFVAFEPSKQDRAIIGLCARSSASGGVRRVAAGFRGFLRASFAARTWHRRFDYGQLRFGRLV